MKLPALSRRYSPPSVAGETHTSIELMTMRDLRHAARTLGKSPMLVLVATLSLGLGVGVNTTLYSVFRTVFSTTVKTRSEPC